MEISDNPKNDMHILTNLFRTYVEHKSVSIIELQDKNHKPVAALYLDKVNSDDFVISTTNNEEKYYLYMLSGIGVFFTYFRKL